MQHSNDELFHSHMAVQPEFVEQLQEYGMNPSWATGVIATPYIATPMPSAKSEVVWDIADTSALGEDSITFVINNKQTFLKETWLVQDWPAIRLKRERAERHEAIAWAPNFATMRVKEVEFKVDNELVHSMKSLAIKAQNEVLYPMSDEAYCETTGQIQSLISFDRENNTQLHSYTTRLPQRVCYDATNPFPIAMFATPVTQKYSLLHLANMLVLRVPRDDGGFTYQRCPVNAIELVSGGEPVLKAPRLLCQFSTMDKQKLSMTLLSMKRYNFMFKPVVLIDTKLSCGIQGKMQIGSGKTTDLPLRQLIIAAENYAHSQYGSELMLTCDNVDENHRRSPLTVLNDSTVGRGKLIETTSSEMCDDVSFITMASSSKGSVMRKGWHTFKFHNDFKSDFYDCVRDTCKTCDIFFSLNHYNQFNEVVLEAQDAKFNVYLMAETVKFLCIERIDNRAGYSITSNSHYCAPPLPVLKE